MLLNSLRYHKIAAKKQHHTKSERFGNVYVILQITVLLSVRKMDDIIDLRILQQIKEEVRFFFQSK